MYRPDDTIIAISSPSIPPGATARTIIRISGPAALDITENIAPAAPAAAVAPADSAPAVSAATITVDGLLDIDAFIYRFIAPNSYTGQDVAEIHFFASAPVAQRIFAKLSARARLAEPGEFTLRAYLNGRMDLSAAEAVAEIISATNRFQLAAAEKLLSGRLTETTAKIAAQILQTLSLLEAGLDFSSEDIELITSRQTRQLVEEHIHSLQDILNNAVRCEELIDMPSIGLAGLTNTGKSSLLNALLGRQRSIVSDRKATTRDVLCGILRLGTIECTIFDCAGLSPSGTDDILGRLSQDTALQALHSADIVVFCVDITKDDFTTDLEAEKLIQPQNLILAATKSDLLTEDRLNANMQRLNTVFGIEPVFTSALTGITDNLVNTLASLLRRIRSRPAEGSEYIRITERHRQLIEQAIKSLAEAADEIETGNNEIASMLLRSACCLLDSFERPDIDEAILDNIFSRFCIGK